jgi:hypothetical protein
LYLSTSCLREFGILSGCFGIVAPNLTVIAFLSRNYSFPIGRKILCEHYYMLETYLELKKLLRGIA